MILVGALVIYTTMCCTLSPGWYDAKNIFQFFSLPFSFSFRLELICLACVLGYVLLLVLARQVNAWHGQRRIVPAPSSKAFPLQLSAL